MKLDAYIISWNEADVIRFTIQHYQSLGARVILYDNHSDDGTPDIARAMGAEVVPFGIPGVLSDDEYLKVKNHTWKHSDADWVIVCDTDEIIYHPRLLEVLRHSLDAGDTIMTTWGWQVVSLQMPRTSWLDIMHGYHYANYSKSAVFSPKLQEIGYVHGCHEARPKGRIQYSKDTLLLAHYANVGGPWRLIKRHAAYRERMSERNRKWGMGIHYMTPDMRKGGITNEERFNRWTEQYAQSEDFSPGLIWPSGPEIQK